MIAGLDSAYAPSSASAAAAHLSGVRLWAGYFAGPNILNGWSKADFDRVKAAGLSTMAYCSGWSDPKAMRAQSDAWQVPICLDVEGGIRGFGPWMTGWLASSGAGLYGNPPVHPAMTAAFHVMAAYPGSDPGRTWIGARPPTPCGWQWQGSHPEFGCTVDRGWYDDAFLQLSTAGGGQIDMATQAEIEAAIKNSGLPGGVASVYAQLTDLNAKMAALIVALEAIRPPAPSAITAQKIDGTFTGTLK